MNPLEAEYLAAIGKCCGVGCTNCPYIPKHQKDTTTIDYELLRQSTERTKSSSDYQ